MRVWLKEHLSLSLADSAAVPGHSTALDYLEHAFLGDLADGAPPEARPADCVVWANRGGGKTYLGAVATALDLIYKPGIEVRILAGSLEQAGKMHRYLRELFDIPELKKQLKRPVTERQVLLSNGSRAELLAQSETSVRGTRVQKLRCDEVELFGRAIWDAAQLTTRVRRLGGWRVRGAIECFSTMHRGYGLMSRLVEESARGKRRLFRWGVLDVLETCPAARECGACALEPDCGGRAKGRDPGGHLAIEDALQQQSRVDRRTWEAEMLSLRPQRTDCVFEDFTLERHVFAGEPPAGGWWAAGMDFGFRAPTVVLWGHVDGRGVLRVCHEHVRADTVLSRHIRAILDGARPRPQWVAIDPAGRATDYQTGKSAAEVMREAGLETRARRQKIHIGVGLVRARLAPADGSPSRLLVHERCRHLIRAMQEYHYDREKPESEDPVKDGENDHATDALRYLVHALDRAKPMRVTSAFA